MDRVIHATGYSMASLSTASHGESAFRQELWLALSMAPLALWIGRGWVETALLIGSRVRADRRVAELRHRDRN